MRRLLLALWLLVILGAVVVTTVQSTAFSAGATRPPSGSAAHLDQTPTSPILLRAGFDA